MITNFSAFYNETANYLRTKATVHHVVNLNGYFSPNTHLPSGIRANTLQCVLYHFALEGQDDGQFKSFTINMTKNEPTIRMILFDYDYKKVLNQYQNEDDLYQAIEKALPKLNHKSNNYHYFPRYYYACTLWDACNALNRYNSYKQFVKNLQANKLPGYLINGINSSFKTTYRKGIRGIRFPLACNILKEIDTVFDMAKPDDHIKQFLSDSGHITLTGDDQVDSISAINAMRAICNNINSSLSTNVSVYQLDRMLWLICTETFFYDDNIPNRGPQKRNVFVNHMRKRGLI